MDANHFDDLLRSLSEMPTRRSLTRALASMGVAGGLTSLLGLADGEAKKKRKKKKKKCKGGTKKCGKKCISATSCCSAADCTNGRICQSGTCTCPMECCADADCGAGYLCLEGQCIVGSGGCQADNNYCAPAPINTCLGPGCNCYATMEGAMRCGTAPSEPVCSQCTTDADCAELGYDLGVFCAKGNQVIEPIIGCCPAAVGFCKNPCSG